MEEGHPDGFGLWLILETATPSALLIALAPITVKGPRIRNRTEAESLRGGSDWWVDSGTTYDRHVHAPTTPVLCNRHLSIYIAK